MSLQWPRRISRILACRFLAERPEKLGRLADKSTADLGWAKREVGLLTFLRSFLRPRGSVLEQSAEHSTRWRPAILVASHEMGDREQRTSQPAQVVLWPGLGRNLQWSMRSVGALEDAVCNASVCPDLQVYSVSPDISAFDAMLDMSRKGVSAFAVVSGSGKLIGNFSTSELRWVEGIHRRRARPQIAGLCVAPAWCNW